MNLQQFQYVVEIDKTHSITRAAENLCMNQPNLSRSIRELEHELGFSIFQRTAKGILLTPKGEELVARAKKIMVQVETIQKIGKQDYEQSAFSISVPRASYISTALTRFISSLDQDHPVEIDYKETNAMRAIDNILKKNYHMAIVRFQTFVEQSFLTLFQNKGLRYEEIVSFSCRVLMSRKHPLAERDTLNLNDLEPYFELAYGDPYIPSLNFTQAKQTEVFSNPNKRVYVYDRGSQFDILCDTPYAYMWASPMPGHILERCELVSKPCKDVSRIYKDMLIHPIHYRLRPLDKRFLEELRKTRDQVFGDISDQKAKKS